MYFGFQRGPRPEQSDQRQPDQAAASLIGPKHCAIRPQLPAGLGFRQGQARSSQSRMPKRDSSQTVTKYKKNVTRQPIARLGQNAIPLLNSAGTSKNIGSDGRIYQNVASAWLAIRSASPVSARAITFLTATPTATKRSACQRRDCAWR